MSQSCAVSQVCELYAPRFEPYRSWLNVPDRGLLQSKELGDLIHEFRNALNLATLQDRVSGASDCVDPDKAKLMELVEKLEERVNR